MAITWFKLHHDLPDDIKLRRFTSQEKWAWVALLCLASKSTERGVITADNDDIADYCEFNCTQDWLYYRDKLITKGMLEFNRNGNLCVTHWQDRQYEKPSDRPESVRERVRKHRAKKKSVDETPCNALQTPCNADETPQIRLDTDPDPDQENTESNCSSSTFVQPSWTNESDEQNSVEVLEAEFVESSSKVVHLDQRKKEKFSREQFEQFWSITTLKVGKAKAKEQFFKIRGVDFETLLTAWDEQQRWHIERDGHTRYLKRPATWLNPKQRGWEDELPTTPDISPKDIKAKKVGMEWLERMQAKQSEVVS